MKIKAAFFIFGIFLISTNLKGQLTISNGHHVLELTGSLSTYYNYRFLKEGEENMRKNRFKLRDAQMQIEGRYKNLFEYELQFDIADIALGTSGPIDPENPGLMDAYVKYKGIPHLGITVGYARVPYSRSSLTPFIYSAYWQRAQLVRGDLFSRRDAGITLSTDFWKQRIKIFGGVYTGLGEISLRGDNDASGALEYIGRVEAAFPARYRYRETDTRHSPLPMFSVGLNGRYTNRNLPEGTVIPQFAAGDYGIKNIDGKKLTYGLDVAAQYKGFSAQFEIHQIRLEPNNPNSFLFQGLLPEEHEGFVLAGGYVIQLNYFVKPLKLILSARFEEMNLNDLAAGVSRRGSAAMAYQINGFNSMIKAQFFKIFEEEIIDPLRWNEQFRIGYQYNFK